MLWRLAVGGCVASAAILSACSSSSDEDCGGGCEQVQVSGPHVYVASGGAAIAAIETASPCASGHASCGLSWSTPALSGTAAVGTPIVLAPEIDAGWASEVCAERFLCAPASAPAGDSATGCGEAWLDVGASNCVLTIVATTGERRTFETELGPCTYYRCRTGLGQCVTSGGCSALPTSISVTFAPAAPSDAGVVDAPSGID
jgi:hypothetical protein